MRFNLKDKALSFQIWIIVGGVIILSFIIIMLTMPFVLRRAFINESYSHIKDNQEYLLQDNRNFLDELEFNNKQLTPGVDSLNSSPPFRTVKHFYITENGEFKGVGHQYIDLDKESILNTIKQQDEKIKNYETNLNNNKTILAVIRKINDENKNGYLVSYLFSDYPNNLAETTFRRLFKLILLVIFISWIASIFLARYLTKPLRTLEKKVKSIAAHNWDDEVKLNREDEIGELGESVEWMRKELIKQDKKEQEFLQQVSHELKTPIMVIRSYVESIADGIFPQGDLESSLEVIEKETYDLEKRVGELLNITKYDYMARHKFNKEEFDISKLIEKKVESFSWLNSELDWKLNLNSFIFVGVKDEIESLVENILDNMVRYAENKIIIDIKENNDNLIIKFYNDGPTIKDDMIDSLFDKYKKGEEGKNGLGLAIVKKIAEIHNGNVEVQNEDNGVAFYITLSLKK